MIWDLFCKNVFSERARSRNEFNAYIKSITFILALHWDPIPRTKNFTGHKCYSLFENPCLKYECGLNWKWIQTARQCSRICPLKGHFFNNVDEFHHYIVRSWPFLHSKSTTVLQTGPWVMVNEGWQREVFLLHCDLSSTGWWDMPWTCITSR